MSSKLSPFFGARCLAVLIAVGLLSIPSSSAADGNDHSYLPPWMLTESGAVRKANEKLVPPGEGLQPVKAEALAVKAKEPNSAGLTATAMGTRVVGFVSSLFKKSVRFATGE